MNTVTDLIRKLNQIKKKYKDAEVFVLADSGMTLEKLTSVGLCYVSKHTNKETFATDAIYTQEEFKSLEMPDDFKLIVVVG